MKIIRNTKPISDLYNGMRTGEMVINKEYQRSSGLWPANARSYFIDTILNDFPFPKVVLWQIVDLKTRKTKIEIIDGQQRLSTIRDFIEGKFRLSSVSKNYSGMTYSDLTEEKQADFLSYEVSLDNVVSGSKEEILEIFRRINSYTLALNKSEQRYASYQGQFKWFINELTDLFYPFISKYKLLTEREISRMEDDRLISELCLVYLKGISTRSTKVIDDLYKENDKDFVQKEEIKKVIIETFSFIKDNLTSVFDSCQVAEYNFYSLFTALMFRRFGFLSLASIPENIVKTSSFCDDINQASERLIYLFTAVENKDTSDPDTVKIVNASKETTHSKKNRLIRFEEIYKAL